MFTYIRGVVNDHVYYGLGLQTFFPGETPNDVRNDIMHFVPELEIETSLNPSDNIILTNRRKDTNLIYDNVQIMTRFEEGDPLILPTKRTFGIRHSYKPFYEIETLLTGENQTFVFQVMYDLLMKRLDIGIEFKSYSDQRIKKRDESELKTRLECFCKDIHIGYGIIPEKIYSRKYFPNKDNLNFLNETNSNPLKQY